MKRMIAILIVAFLFLTACSKSIPEIPTDSINTSLQNASQEGDLISVKPTLDHEMFTPSAPTSTDVPDSLCQANITLIPKNEPITYTVSTKTHTEKKYTSHDDFIDVYIEYPQISDYSDPKQEAAINQILKESALFNYKEMWTQERLELHSQYSVVCRKPNFLSVVFFGDVFPGPVRPSKIFHAVTVDLKNGKKVSLSDIVGYDRQLEDMFMSGKFTIRETDGENNGEINYDQFFHDFNKSAYTPDHVNEFFVTDDKLVLIIHSIFAIGGHIEFEITFRDVIDALELDHPIWSEFFTVEIDD